MKQKGLAPILIVLLISLAVGGYLIYQKQFRPASTAQSLLSSTTSNSTKAYTDSR